MAWCLTQAPEAMCLLRFSVLSSDSFFVIFPISLRPSLRLNLLCFFLLIFLRAFLRLNQPFSTKLFFFHPVQQQNKRMFKFLCTNYFNFHGGIFYELRPAWGLFEIHPSILILSFLEDPRLGFWLVLLFGRAAPSALGTPWDLCLEPRFLSLMPSSSFLREPQLQGCSLAASPGQVLTLVWNIGSKSCFFKSW